MFTNNMRGFWRGRLPLICALAVLIPAVTVVVADHRFSGHGLWGTSAVDVREALHAGPIVAPVRRTLPVTPPWSMALIAAGDIVPPQLAPDTAPLPVRKNASLALLHGRTAEHASDDDAARTALAATSSAPVAIKPGASKVD